MYREPHSAFDYDALDPVEPIKPEDARREAAEESVREILEIMGTLIFVKTGKGGYRSRRCIDAHFMVLRILIGATDISLREAARQLGCYQAWLSQIRVKMTKAFPATAVRWQQYKHINCVRTGQLSQQTRKRERARQRTEEANTNPIREREAVERPAA